MNSKSQKLKWIVATANCWFKNNPEGVKRYSSLVILTNLHLVCDMFMFNEWMCFVRAKQSRRANPATSQEAAS
jgi:hypothetical protein